MQPAPVPDEPFRRVPANRLDYTIAEKPVWNAAAIKQAGGRTEEFPGEVDHILADLVCRAQPSEKSNAPIIAYVKAYVAHLNDHVLDPKVKAAGISFEIPVYASYEDTEKSPQPTEKFYMLVRLGSKTQHETTRKSETEGEGLLYSAHTDIVGAGNPEEWKHVLHNNPYQLVQDGNALIGRGSMDMLSFLAASLKTMHDTALQLNAVAETEPEALPKALKQSMNILLSFNEEVGCAGIPIVVEHLEKQRYRFNTAIIGEPTDFDIGMGHRGTLDFRSIITPEAPPIEVPKTNGNLVAERITLQGYDVHSSQPPENGISAIEHAAALIKDMETLNAGHAPYPAIQITNLHGGTSRGTIAADCSFDLHYPVTMAGEVQRLLETAEEALQTEFAHKALERRNKDRGFLERENPKTTDMPARMAARLEKELGTVVLDHRTTVAAAASIHDIYGSIRDKYTGEANEAYHPTPTNTFNVGKIAPQLDGTLLVHWECRKLPEMAMETVRELEKEAEKIFTDNFRGFTEDQAEQAAQMQNKAVIRLGLSRHPSMGLPKQSIEDDSPIERAAQAAKDVSRKLGKGYGSFAGFATGDKVAKVPLSYNTEASAIAAISDTTVVAGAHDKRGEQRLLHAGIGGLHQVDEGVFISQLIAQTVFTHSLANTIALETERPLPVDKTFAPVSEATMEEMQARAFDAEKSWLDAGYDKQQLRYRKTGPVAQY